MLTFIDRSPLKAGPLSRGSTVYEKKSGRMMTAMMKALQMPIFMRFEKPKQTQTCKTSNVQYLGHSL